MEHAGGEMKIHEFLITAVVMFIVAYMFCYGWDLQSAIDDAKRAAHMDTLLYPEPPVKVYVPKPSDLAEPKVRYFQDASQPKGK
jgi:hypothetical protein